MTTDPKIKSPREDLITSVARFSQMLDDLRATVDEGAPETVRAVLPALMIGSGLVLVVRALLLGSDEVAGAIADLDPHQL